MILSLSIPVLLKDIKQKSHYEVSNITDAEARYRAQAGTEKEDEIYRSMVEVASSLKHRLRRYLDESYQEEADDQVAIPDSFIYCLSVSDRRADNLLQPLTDAAHNYVVHYTLSKFYSSVSQGELSNKHSKETADAAKTIDELIYTKQPPI